MVNAIKILLWSLLIESLKLWQLSDSYELPNFVSEPNLILNSIIIIKSYFSHLAG